MSDELEDCGEPLVCVLCGAPWPMFANRCKGCGGFCTWGKEKDGPPSSWDVTDEGWTPKPPPADAGHDIIPRQPYELRDKG